MQSWLMLSPHHFVPIHQTTETKLKNMSARLRVFICMDLSAVICQAQQVRVHWWGTLPSDFQLNSHLVIMWVKLHHRILGQISVGLCRGFCCCFSWNPSNAVGGHKIIKTCVIYSKTAPIPFIAIFLSLDNIFIKPFLCFCFPNSLDYEHTMNSYRWLLLQLIPFFIQTISINAWKYHEIV